MNASLLSHLVCDLDIGVLISILSRISHSIVSNSFALVRIASRLLILIWLLIGCEFSPFNAWVARMRYCTLKMLSYSARKPRITINVDIYGHIRWFSVANFKNSSSIE